MALTKSNKRLRELINKAIEDHKITIEEYDEILDISFEDGHIDSQEQAMLTELQKMIENKEIRFAKGE
jgi:glutamate-1-semialdehyde aminotransferase